MVIEVCDATRVTLLSELETVVTRMFDEPREMVFDEYLAMQSEYCEIARPARLVYLLVPEGRGDRRALVTVDFEHVGRQTKLTERILHQTVEDRNARLCAGATDRLNRLGERLRVKEEEQSESVVVAEARRWIAV